MARTKLVNGVIVPFTTEEETARDAEEAAWAAEQERYEREDKWRDERKALYYPVEKQLEMLYDDIKAGKLTTGTFVQHNDEVHAMVEKPNLEVIKR